MAKPAPRRTPVIWIALAVVLVAVVAVFLFANFGTGGTTSTSLSSSSTSSVTTSTTTSTTCAGSSTTQTITIISGPVVVGTTGEIAAGVTCADGHLGTILSYDYGQPINIQVTVANSLVPTAIQTVVDGNPQNTNTWDFNSTGSTYVLGYGSAGNSPLTTPGTHDVYAVVTFANDTNATSNVVYFTVTGAPVA